MKMDHPVSIADYPDLDRRNFLKIAGGVTGTVLLSSALSTPLLAQSDPRPVPMPAITDPAVRALVFRGVQAAREAGAAYAEVRLTHGLIRSVDMVRIHDAQTVHASVKAFVNGRWGFASGPLWDTEAIVALARRAVLQSAGKASEAGGPPLEFDALPARARVPNAHWQMPVSIDPLSVHPYAIQDYLQGLASQAQDGFGRRLNELVRLALDARFFVQERAFGASDESYCTQRLYLTSGSVQLSLLVRGGGGAAQALQHVSPAGEGWELFTRQPLNDRIVETFRTMQMESALPAKPVTPGARTLVLDAVTVARLVSQTIGAPSEIDRVLGYDAHAHGASYLNRPASMIDTFAVGSPLLTVTANRSASGGAATVHWDDEGVAPQPFTIVKAGVLHDYHLSREGVAWLKREQVTGRDQPYGVVSASSAGGKPYIRTANLEIAPSTTQSGDAELMAQVGNGIVIEEGNVHLDPSRLNGIIVGGRAYEIKGGKKVARLGNHAVVIHTPTLWKSLAVLGGANSAVRVGLAGTKGVPSQESYHSVTAVPAVFREQLVTDITLR